MKRFASIAALCAASFLPACTVVTNAPPENPPQATGSRGWATVVKPEASGRPVNLKSGQNEAFWIWRGGKGDWHLRTTTAGTKHRFNGHIVGHGGDISGVQSAKTEAGDKVKFDSEGGKIHFDFTTDGFEDGLDFTLAGNSCADFDLAIDGTPRPERIVVGSKEERPTKARFTACP